MEIFPKDPFKTVEAQIISSGEGKVMGSWEGPGGGLSLGDRELGIAVFGSEGLATHGR